MGLGEIRIQFDGPLEMGDRLDEILRRVASVELPASQIGVMGIRVVGALSLLAFLLVGAGWARSLQDAAISPLARALQLGGWALLFVPLQLACDYGIAVFMPVASILEPRFLVALHAIGIDQLQHPHLLGVMRVQFTARNTVARSLMQDRVLHLLLDLEMILIWSQFAIFQFSEPVTPVFVDVVFVFQITRVEFLDECSVSSGEIALLLHFFHAHGGLPVDSFQGRCCIFSKSQ